MQVFVRNNEFESNLSDARNFSLGDPNVICRILSDYLYSNKIGSIVRELSANALDAHRMAGCLDRPFSVHVPGLGEGLFDVSDTDFSIRDYGPGLSEQGIYDLYTSYGASSKREDQEQIGGFGIGSKSPFAYTKAFEVVSWHGGRKAQYICFQDEGGSPCVKKLHEEDSAEPSGIMVKFAVDDEGDRRRFRSECQFQYAWLNPRPSCNAMIPEATPVYENAHGICYPCQQISPIAGLMPGGRYSSGEYHVLANACVYGLGDMYSRRAFPNYGYASMPFNECWCLLKIDGADVDISASREELAFTDRTEEAVKKAYNAFFNEACREIWDEMHRDAEASLFEASWKWRSKNLNAAAVARWAKNSGMKSDRWDFEHLDQLAMQYVPLDGSAIWKFLTSAGKGYEILRKSSSGTLSALSKMTKDVLDKDAKGRHAAPNFRSVSCSETLEESGAVSEIGMELHVAGCEDFRLCFVKKGTKYSDIKEMVQESASRIGRGGIVHVYAVSSEKERNGIVEAYGRPDQSRIFLLDEDAKPKGAKPAVRRSGSGKRDLVRTKVSSMSTAAALYGGGELLYRVRMSAKEEWLTVDAIQKKLQSNGVLLVLDGTELSGEYPQTFHTFLNFVSRVAGRTEIPYEWVLMNSAAYRKYIALGGRKAEEDDALEAAQKLLRKLEIEPEDYWQWALGVVLEDALKFESVNSGCDFSIASDGHGDSPYVKAFFNWKRVQDILSRSFSNTESLARFLYGHKGSLCSLKTMKEVREKASAAMNLAEVQDWLDRNPILNLLRNRYSNSADRAAVADIIGKYLVW